MMLKMLILLKHYKEDDFSGTNVAATAALSLSTHEGGIEKDTSDAVTLFEESRVNLLVCFDHVFP